MNGVIRRITSGFTPTYLYCAFAFSVNLSYCCLLLLLSIFSVILFSCRHYGIVGREALCCLCLINHFVLVCSSCLKTPLKAKQVKRRTKRSRSSFLVDGRGAIIHEADTYSGNYTTRNLISITPTETPYRKFLKTCISL